MQGVAFISMIRAVIWQAKRTELVGELTSVNQTLVAALGSMSRSVDHSALNISKEGRQFCFLSLRFWSFFGLFTRFAISEEIYTMTLTSSPGKHEGGERAATYGTQAARFLFFFLSFLSLFFMQ